MALSHALPGTVIDLHPLGAALAHTPTAALFKSAALEVVRLVLAAGKTLPTHRVPGQITVQCLEGSIVFDADGTAVPMIAGQLLYLEGGVPHAVTAVEDAAVLVTIVLGG